MALTLNPNFNWARFGGNALQDIGVGLTQSPTVFGGLARGAQINQAQQPYRDQQATLEEERKREALEKNQTSEWLKTAYPEYAHLPPKQGFDLAMAAEAAKRDAAKPQYFNADGTIVGVDGGKASVLYGGQPEPTKPTSAMQEYEYAKSQGYTGTFQQYETDLRKAGATNIDFNQNQGAAAGYADRMAAANAILDDPKVIAAQTDLGEQAKSGVPWLGNFITSTERKMADQAQRDFINAILRRESGAVISPSEFENAKQQYFPQPGDPPEIVEQKRQNRIIALQGVQRAAGPNYQAPTLTPPGVVQIDDLVNKYLTK